MSWARIYNLYLDLNAVGKTNPLLAGTSSSPLGATVRWVQGDKFTLRIYPRTTAGVATASTSVQLESGSAVKIAAKAAKSDSSFLFLTTSFTEVNDSGTYYYYGTIDLSTAEIATALTSADSVTALVDIEIQNSGNTERATFPLEITIVKQVYDSASAPTAATPPTLVPGPGGTWYALTVTSDGQLQWEQQ